MCWITVPMPPAVLRVAPLVCDASTYTLSPALNRRIRWLVTCPPAPDSTMETVSHRTGFPFSRTMSREYLPRIRRHCSPTVRRLDHVATALARRDGEQPVGSRRHGTERVLRDAVVIHADHAAGAARLRDRLDCECVALSVYVPLRRGVLRGRGVSEGRTTGRVAQDEARCRRGSRR